MILYNLNDMGAGNFVVVYTVKPGDTLSEIAQMFGCTVEHLRRCNPGLSVPTHRFFRDGSLIYPEDILLIDHARPGGPGYATSLRGSAVGVPGGMGERRTGQRRHSGDRRYSTNKTRRAGDNKISGWARHFDRRKADRRRK